MFRISLESQSQSLFCYPWIDRSTYRTRNVNKCSVSSLDTGQEYSPLATDLTTVMETHVDVGKNLTVPFDLPMHSIADTTLSGEQWREDAATLLHTLQEAVLKRTTTTTTPPHTITIPPHTITPTSTKMINGVAKVGVLFSGGLDSIVLAAIADRCPYTH